MAAARYATGTVSMMEHGLRAEPSQPRNSRVSKACENCRTRRVKCVMDELSNPCLACQAADLHDCSVREKARPRRPQRGAPQNGACLRDTAYHKRTNGLRRIERLLAEAYEQNTGKPIDLKLGEPTTHPLLDLATPSPRRPQLEPSAFLAIQTFTIYGLPYCSFLTAQRIINLFERYSHAPASLASDQTALVLSCLACGYLRLQTFGENGRVARHIADADRLDVPWYRSAIDVLINMAGATFTSLHALSVMWWYTTMTCNDESSRAVTSWMIGQARELGINRERTASATPFSPADRADLMFFQVLYAHYLSIGTCSFPPMFKAGEFDTVVMQPFQPAHSESPAALVPRRAYLELTLMGTQNLLYLYDDTVSALSIDWLLRIEDGWAQWMQAWVRDGRTTGMEFADQFVGVLWDWGRLLVRAAVMEDSRFSISSFAILARSATQILSRYHDFYLSQHYNLVSQHIRHIVTSAHVVLLCYLRFELTKREAERSLSTATWILRLCEPRWTTQVREAREKIEIMAVRLGMALYLIQAPEDTLDPPDWLTNLADNAQAGLLFTNTDDFNQDTFDFVFESGA